MGVGEGAPRGVLRGLAARARAARAAIRYDGVVLRRWAYAGAVDFPEWFRQHAPPVLGTAFYAALGSKRAAVAHNQALLLGVRPGSLAAQRAARRVFAAYANCLTDALETAGAPERPYARQYEGAALYEGARAQGRGVILVSGHVGSWEVAGRLLARTRDEKVTLVMAAEPNEGARAFAESLRRRHGVDVVYASGHDPATALTLLSRLRKNEVVAIQIDRAPASATSVEVRLLGAPFEVPEGPFRLAQASGAPIVPVFTRRSGYRRYTLTFAEPIAVARRGGEGAVRDGAQRVASALERFVRAHPDQWFHFAPLDPG